MTLLVVLVLLLIISGVIVFSGFFDDEPEDRDQIKVLSNKGEREELMASGCFLPLAMVFVRIFSVLLI